MESWEALLQFFQTLLTICGGITCVVGCITAVGKLFAPFKELKAKVDEHEEKLTKDSDEMEEMRSTIKQVAEADKILCAVLLEMLDHEITGNHIERLKKTRGKLEKYIIDNQFEW